MDDKAWELLLREIDEIKSDLKDVKKGMNGLKVKVAAFSSAFGLLAAFIKTKLHL